MSHINGYIAVDLDATLAEYDGWQGPEHIGKPVPKMLERVLAWLKEGAEVRIFTARMGTECEHERSLFLASFDAWCLEHIGRILIVTNKKDYGMVQLWDDRCVQVMPNTGELAVEVVADETRRLCKDGAI